jgi:hypothetical protein
MMKVASSSGISGLDGSGGDDDVMMMSSQL